MKPIIAVLGSLHLDTVVRAPRLPVLGETLIGSGQQQQAGGKGLNQAVACARAGTPTRMFGAVGDDVFGGMLLAHLARHGVDASDVRTLAGQPSGMSIAIIEAAGDNAAVVVSGVNARLCAADVSVWEPRLRECAALVLQNEIPVETNRAAARLMAGLGRPVVLNAAPARTLSPESLAGVSVLVVNAVEAEMMGAPPVVELSSAAIASGVLRDALGMAVVVTAGPRGAAFAAPGSSPGQVPGRSVPVVSTLGAGDTFIGTLAAGLVSGQTLGDAVASANAAAARHISGQTSHPTGQASRR